MIGRTHEAGAAALLLTAAIYYPQLNLGWATIAAALIANVVGAMLPDIDQASNRLWDMLPGGNFLGKILRNLFLAHRTLSHSLLGLAMVYKISQWLLPRIFNSNFINPQIVLAGLLIGYISHLILDGLTEEGLPLLFPLKWKFGFPPFKHLRIKTGHWVENWVVFPLILVYIGGMIYYHWLKP